MSAPEFPATSRSLSFAGPEGPLEALYEPAEGGRGGAVICHPHPLHAGTMHNKVVYRAAKGALAAGWSTLRFNFRGVGRSAGVHAHGEGEREDVRSALDELERRHPAQPLLAAGFSFGASVALRAAGDDPRVERLLAIGLSVRHGGLGGRLPEGKPLLLIHGEEDTLAPLEDVRALVAQHPAARLEVIPGADHFFDGRLDRLRERVESFCREGGGERG